MIQRTPSQRLQLWKILSFYFSAFPVFLPFWLLLRQHFFSHRLCGSKCALCPFVRVLWLFLPLEGFTAAALFLRHLTTADLEMINTFTTFLQLIFTATFELTNHHHGQPLLVCLWVYPHITLVLINLFVCPVWDLFSMLGLWWGPPPLCSLCIFG